eukprot:gb/GEZN01019525.1/.p1 GENE.gb/GEZN01019525.1/~~gb/GEZN01019525.1/.p1  ORF type:complete len:131 (-),score=13.97 gb/GEZN01019525.1/:272-664(-)
MCKKINRANNKSCCLTVLAEGGGKVVAERSWCDDVEPLCLLNNCGSSSSLSTVCARLYVKQAMLVVFVKKPVSSSLSDARTAKNVLPRLLFAMSAVAADKHDCFFEIYSDYASYFLFKTVGRNKFSHRFS